jgi:hypothetical protein
LEKGVRAGKRSILTQMRTWPWPPAGIGAARAHDFLELGCRPEFMLQGRWCFDQAARSIGCGVRPGPALTAAPWRGLHRRPVPVGALQPAPYLSFLEEERGKMEEVDTEKRM